MPIYLLASQNMKTSSRVDLRVFKMGSPFGMVAEAEVIL